MAYFMTQFSYTSDAWAQMVKNPQDRSEVVRPLIEKMGGKLLGFYYSFGEYDGLIITEAPNEKAVVASLMAAISAGHLKTVKTTVLFSNKDAMEAMKKAGEFAYQVPQG